MKVFLTFDIEVWCNGWDALDRNFGPAFERYVYGRSRHGTYALPRTLEILAENGLKGVFFVEPLFSARFGPEPLARIVALIREAGQEVQLHLHPEWTDEAREPLIADCARKRQHLTHYTLEEQAALIGHGRRMLEAAGSGPVRAFRSGSFAVNRDSFEALRRNGILLDSSLNRCHAISGPDLRAAHDLDAPFEIAGVTTYPVSVFRDGFGQDRPAQVGACGAAELQQAMDSARAHGCGAFVVVSHNFEMLKAGSTAPDWVVVRRFERLCRHLAGRRAELSVVGFNDVDPGLAAAGASTAPAQPHAGWPATAARHAEQLQRRLVNRWAPRHDAARA